MCAEITKVSPLAPKAGFPNLPMVKGVRFAAAAAGVKYAGRDDVMLAELCPGATVAGVFTRSATRSAPVLDCQAKLAAGHGTGETGAAILVNSGNSNAFTGRAGDASVQALTQALAQELALPGERIFTASTGVIGEPLPHEKIVATLSDLHSQLSADQAERAARAIMTTDTFPKGATRTVDLDGTAITIAGFAKGSGMIAPDMATMLVYIFTDAKVSADRLQTECAAINAQTFNRITVDSDTSTSDSLMLAATGQSGADLDAASATGQAGFRDALHDVMLDLAHQVVRDGEGATKFVTVDVTGAANEADAERVARAIADSPLVKTAVAGEDPNWGRIVMAIGKSGAAADRDRLTIHFGEVLVAENGWVSPTYSEEAGATYMQREDITIRVDLAMGNGAATVWTCDLTHGYITINADYRS